MNRGKKLIFIAFGIFLVSVFIYGGFSVMKTGEVNVIKAEPAEVEVKSQEDNEKKLYMIKEYLGNIGIYQKGADSYILVNIIDTNVNELPGADIDSLKKGIYLDNEQQMLMLIEDFTS